MQRFKFRLERVMQWQKKVCQLKENDVRLSLLAISEADQRIEQLRATSLAAEHESLQRAALTSADLTALARFRIRVVKDRAALAALKAELAQTLEQRRESLRAERRRLRLLEKLRSRSLDEYNLASNRESEELATECHLSRWVSEAFGQQSGGHDFRPGISGGSGAALVQQKIDQAGRQLAGADAIGFRNEVPAGMPLPCELNLDGPEILR